MCVCVCVCAVVYGAALPPFSHNRSVCLSVSKQGVEGQNVWVWRVKIRV
jgi:hypothetical protein